jgi:hypothetical protein
MNKDNNHHGHGRPRPDCPRCGGVEVKPIVYGFVDVGAYLELGKCAPDFELGGLTPHDENWCCLRCGHKWAGAQLNST